MIVRQLNKFCLLIGILLFSLASCKKFLPKESENLSDDMNFLTTTYSPVLGRDYVFSGNFNSGTSSLPLNFSIVNMRHADGSAAPELNVSLPTKVWIHPYLGTETSLTEIDSERTTENLPPFQIREHNGEFVVWSNASSSYVRCQPDPGYLFDVEVSNSGGKTYFKDLKLTPYRERPYEPSLSDPVTGIDTATSLHPTTLLNMVGESSQLTLSLSDVNVFIHKVDTTYPDNNYTLTFKFLDTAYNPIDPAKFNQTNWSTLVHGFNMDKTSTYVRYKVAYPIPLIAYPTQYTTTDGSQAHLQFGYDRIGYGGFRQTTTMTFDFNIYEEGNWEIDFVFPKDNPRFENESY